MLCYIWKFIFSRFDVVEIKFFPIIVSNSQTFAYHKMDYMFIFDEEQKKIMELYLSV
jgi:hypothetical protein